MSKIEGNDPNISGIQRPSYDYNLENSEKAALAIKCFNQISDACASHELQSFQSHKFDSQSSSQLKGLCEYLLNKTQNHQPAKESSCNDLIDLLLRQMVSPIQTNAEECLKTLHQVERVLSDNGVIGKIRTTFNNRGNYKTPA